MRRSKEQVSLLIPILMVALAISKGKDISTYVDNNILKGKELDLSGEAKTIFNGIVDDLDLSKKQKKEIKKTGEQLLQQLDEIKDDKEEEGKQLAQDFYNILTNQSDGEETGKVIDAKVSELSGKELNFVKYDLTDEQIKGIANLCVREQDHYKEAIAAEASVMANIFEINQNGKSSNGLTDAEGLYDFVRNGSWFDTSTKSYNTPNLMDTGISHDGRDCTATEEEIEIVKNVLVNGKRILPGYIDEHGDGSNFDYIEIDGEKYYDVRDKSHWVSNESKFVRTHKDGYVERWTYYCTFEGADPFGYTEEAAKLREKIGDGYYDFKTGKVINGSEEQKEIKDMISEEKEKYVEEFLRNGFTTSDGKAYEGFEVVQTSAIMGNIERECHFDETEQTDQSIGLIQWNGERAEKLREYASSRGTSWEDLDTQLEYILIEFYDSPSTWAGGKEAQKEFLNDDDVYTATTRFLVETEMGKKYTGQSEEELQSMHPNWNLSEGWEKAESTYSEIKTSDENEVDR